LTFSVSSGNGESNKKIQLILLALLNLSKIRSEANLTGVYPACPVKYIEDMEQSEFNRGLSCRPKRI
jgi:hypothetical protein